MNQTIKYMEDRLDTLKVQLDDRIRIYMNYTVDVSNINYEVNTYQQLAIIQDLKSRIDELTAMIRIAKAFEK